MRTSCDLIEELTLSSWVHVVGHERLSWRSVEIISHSLWHSYTAGSTRSSWITSRPHERLIRHHLIVSWCTGLRMWRLLRRRMRWWRWSKWWILKRNQQRLLVFNPWNDKILSTLPGKMLEPSDLLVSLHLLVIDPKDSALDRNSKTNKTIISVSSTNHRSRRLTCAIPFTP